jgi:hypothetical protein
LGSAECAEHDRSTVKQAYRLLANSAGTERRSSGYSRRRFRWCCRRTSRTRYPPSRPARRYIDVAFGITKFGASRQVEILDSTTNATDADKNRLVHLIKGNRFRPRATADGWGRTSSLVVRYYVAE